MKILLSQIVFVILFLFILKTKGYKIEFVSPTINSHTGNNLRNLLYARPNGECYYRDYLEIEDDDGIGVSDVDLVSGTGTIQGRVGDIYLYYIEAQVNIGESSYQITIIDNSSRSYNKAVQCNLCEEPPASISPYKDITQSGILYDTTSFSTTSISLGIIYNVTKSIYTNISCKSSQQYLCSKSINTNYLAALFASVKLKFNSTLSSLISLNINYSDGSVTYQLSSFISNSTNIILNQTEFYPNVPSLWYPNNIYSFITVPKNFTSNINLVDGRITAIFDNNISLTLLGIIVGDSVGNQTSVFKYYNNYQLTNITAGYTILSNISNPFNNFIKGSLVEQITGVYKPRYTYLKAQQNWYNTIDVFDSVLQSVDFEFIFLKQIAVPIPVGLIQGNRKQLQHSYGFMISPYYQSDIDIDTSIDNIQVNSTLPNDTTDPIIISIQYTPIQNLSIILRVEVSDDLSGIFRIELTGYNEKQVFGYMDSRDLVEILDITKNTGIYEKIITYGFDLSNLSPPDIMIRVFDNCGNSVSAQYGSSMNSIQFPLKRFPGVLDVNSDFISFDFITLFQFKFNNINTTNISVNNSLYVKFKSGYLNKDSKIYLIFDTLDPRSVYQGIYNPKSNQFQVDFAIPMNQISGSLPYTFIYPEITLRSIDLLQLLGSGASLNVYSNQGDRLPPLFKSIKTYTLSSSIIYSFEIEDLVNGLKSATISIQNDIDLIPLEFKLNTTGKNIYIDTYNITIPITTPCKYSLQYQIVKVVLEDRGSLISNFQYGESLNAQDNGDKYGINPFLKLTSYSYPIDVACSTPILTTDQDEPIIYKVETSSTTVDVGLSNRKFHLSFFGYDESYISTRHLPICRFMSMYQEFYITGELVLSNGSFSNNFTVLCDTNLPYGFAFPSGRFKVSIHGYSDILYNFGGYLNDAQDYQVIMDLETPILLNYYPFSKSGGILTIQGKKFKNSETDLSNVKIRIDQSNTIYYDLIDDDSFTSVTASINLPAYDSPFNITYFKGDYISNYLTVYPIVFSSGEGDDNDSCQDSLEPSTSTETVVYCSGDPPCGGESNGICLSTGCLCKDDWFGNECLAKVIQLPPPQFNSTKPEVTANTEIDASDGEVVKIQTTLSLVSLIEISPTSGIAANHSLSQWIFQNITGDGPNQRYIYTTNVTNNNKITFINVGVEWFYQEYNIEFANIDLKMNPSSIKYRINMTDYSFNSIGNSLQLMMTASIQSSELNDGSCIYPESGNTTDLSDSEYIKLQIDDHSLYGRFVKRAIIDNSVQSISSSFQTTIDEQTSIVTSTSKTTTNSIFSSISINIPNYSTSVNLDPDFFLLFDYIEASNRASSTCTQGEDRSLTKAQLAGIAIGCVIFFGTIIGVIAYLLYSDKAQKRYLAKMEIELQQQQEIQEVEQQQQQEEEQHIDQIQQIQNEEIHQELDQQ